MVAKICNTKDMPSDDWLRLRKSGIGGSDAAAIVGLNPWKSAASVYLDKVEDRIAKFDSERMRIGRDLEDYVAKRFEEASGKKVRRNNYFMAHDEHRFLAANIDREVVGENAVLECKTTNSFASKDWEDGKVPIHYEIQCHHYMMVAGYERAYIACLIGNEAFVWHVIERDEDVIQMLMELEVNFWNDYVLAKNPPPPDGSDDYDNILKDRFKDSMDEAVDLGREEAEAIKRLDEIKGLEKELKKERKLWEQTLKTALKEAEVGRVDGRLVTWKPQVRMSFDSKRFREEEPELFEKYQKETKYRVLRIKGGSDNE